MKNIIVILADNWGSQKGGINSFNYDLVNSLDDILTKRNIQNYLVACMTDFEGISSSKNTVYVKCDLKNNVDVQAYNLLKSLEKILGQPLTEIKNNYVVEWWIGHDIITGEQAKKMHDQYNEMFDKCSKLAIIHHMSYEDYYYLKQDNPISPEDYESKMKKQKDVISEADAVFAIGPKLKTHAEENTQKEVIELIPGIQKITKNPRKSIDKQTLVTMIVGRIEEKEDPIKQHTLAIEALSNYYKERTHILSGESQIKVLGAEMKDTSWNNFVVPYKYMDKDNVYSEISRSNIGFLISSHEGFGLAGWEFISAGVPLVISKDTGLYLFLKKFIETRKLDSKILLNALDLKPINNKNASDSNDERKKLVDSLEVKIAEIAENLVFYDNQAAMLREELKKIYSWENLAATFLNGLKLEPQFETKITSDNILIDNKFGLVKLTDKNDDRINDFKNCLLNAKGKCFISGTSMKHLADDSIHILKEKITKHKCKIDLLIMDPEWAKKNSDNFTFQKSEIKRNDFYKEIEDSIERLIEIKNELPEELRNNLRIKRYSTFLPYILTGYRSSVNGKIVVEITDYLPEPERLRLVIDLYESEDNAFQKVEDKFYSLWNNEDLTMEVVNE